MAPTRKLGYIAILVVVIVVAYGLSAIYYKTGPVYQELQYLDLIPSPEHFTELYFENPARLPTTETKGVPLTFSFTIDNLEGGQMTYPYIVYFQDGKGRKTVFLNNKVSLENTATTTIAVSHNFLTGNASGTVVVTLTSLNQSIDFLLGN